LHAHFLRAGDGTRPIVFSIDRVRDGRTYSTRSVTAEQDGRLLLDGRLSFQRPADGLSFTDAMPDVPGPEGLRSEDSLRAEALMQTDLQLVGNLAMVGMAFELRPVTPRDFVTPRVMPPVQHFWIRPHQPIKGDWRQQFAALTYASDMMLLSTTLLPHGIYWSTTAMDSASLDHAIWYHALPQFDDWMLWSMETPWSGSGRGLVHGRFYRRDGTLVASTAQEGLIRIKDSPSQ
ncbi:MAG: acyl-CoA thioesterase domain-containing protein, partial [Sphingobium sp.]